MNKYTAVIVVGLLSALLLLSVGCTGKNSEVTNERDGKADTKQVSVYSDAQEVKSYNNGDLANGVSYKLKIPYERMVTPDVLKFYDSKMQERGFKPFVEDYYKSDDRVWQEYIDGTTKGEPLVAKFRAGWVDDKHTTRAQLVLEYHWYENRPSNYIPSKNDDLSVVFSYMPFVVLPPPVKIN